MEKISTELKDCYILKPTIFKDERGYFTETRISDFEELGFKNLCQVNGSGSKKGTLRGLHFQQDPHCQAKVVKCDRGKVLDVVVDIREGSPTFGKYIAVELSPISFMDEGEELESAGRMLYVPRGFAHGFLALEDHTVFGYYVDNLYNKESEAGIMWNDEDINIDWQFDKYGIKEDELLLSDKDQKHLTLKQSPIYFRDNN